MSVESNQRWTDRFEFRWRDGHVTTELVEVTASAFGGHGRPPEVWRIAVVGVSPLRFDDPSPFQTFHRVTFRRVERRVRRRYRVDISFHFEEA